MKLIAHLHPRHDDVDAVLAAASLPEPPAFARGQYELEVGNPSLSAVLALADRAGGFGVSGELALTDAELGLLSHFSVVCRKTAPESDAAYARNHDCWMATPQIQAGAEMPIRLGRGFHLSRIDLKPNTVAGIGEWTEAYVAGPDVWRLLETAGLSGVAPEPVMQVRSGKPFAEVTQLFADHVLPPAIRDVSIGTSLGKFGCLGYRDGQLEDRPDFMVTAEPWASTRHGWPLWIVSARVRTVFREHDVRGWAFQPVLRVDSALYASYLELWNELHAMVAATTHSRFEARVWQG